MSDIFVNLHAHSSFSLNDSVTSPEDMVRKTKELGMNAMNISDHGTLAGHLQFRDACKKHGIKPIFGVEAYFMEDINVIQKSNDRIAAIQEESKALKGDKTGKARLQELILETKLEKKAITKYYHLILLAKDFEGYQNLVKIHNSAVVDGFYGKPRCDFAILEKYKGGLIASSACLGSIVCKDIERNEIEKAKEHINKFKTIFGEDNFYLELQLHDIKQQVIANKVLLELAQITNTKFILSCDSHHNEPSEAYTRSLIYQLSNKSKNKVNDNKKEIIVESQEDEESTEDVETDDTGDYNDGVLTDLYLKNTDMLRISWEKYMPDVPLTYLKKAIEETRKIEQKVSLFQFDTSIKFPKFFTGDISQNEFLKQEAIRGLMAKGLAEDVIYQARLKKELKTIQKLGFASYFNMVSDLVNYAKKHQSVGIGRGSGSGSLVGYCLGITDLDPIKYDLFFERFLDEAKSITSPTFGILDIDKVEINHEQLLGNCACNKKH